MADFEFRLEGLDELQADLRTVVARCPDSAEKEVYKLAGEWYKDVNAKMEFKNGGGGKRDPKGEWHRSRSYGGTMGAELAAVEVSNHAPHWHLLENGHEVFADPKMYAAYKAGKLDHSKRKGKRKHSSNLKHLGAWKPGYQWAAKTREEWQSGILSEKLRVWLDKMLKENNL